MERCPKCGSPRIHPSRARSWFERARRAVTERQPYRCHACEYRGWHPIVVTIPTATGPALPDAPLPPARGVNADDLDRLDTR